MKTKTITLAGTAMAAIYAAGSILYAQAAPSAKENADEKQITRQLNESQMQHPGAVTDTGQTGPTAEDMNNVNADKNDQYNNPGTTHNNMSGQNAPATPQNGNPGMQTNAAPPSDEEMRQAVSLSDVPNARDELQSAPIKTRSGEQIGTVQSVEVNSDGTARAIRANVHGKQVSFDANNLVYLKDQNALVTDMTGSEIENLPPASKSY